MDELDPTQLPRHIAIIMDGNGRWAARHGLSCAEGHESGAKSVRAAIEACRELGGVDVLSLYAFSTENWRRSEAEISALFGLLSKYIHLELENIHREGIRVRIMGRREGLPDPVLNDLEYCEARTRDNRQMTLNVAFNYGGRAEIADAARRIARDAAAGVLRPDEVDEAAVAQRLYVPEIPDVDLLIRTSGEQRLSNFMLWQVSYAEIVTLGVLWPDFRKRHLREAIARYQKRQRRFGGR
ncbi:MAG: polyprenyl diphosphate synthase [Candidatus Hydrogenedentales bacterium]|jgi:undecaprenyl diphosphate synthase